MSERKKQPPNNNIDNSEQSTSINQEASNPPSQVESTLENQLKIIRILKNLNPKMKMIQVQLNNL